MGKDGVRSNSNLKGPTHRGDSCEEDEGALEESCEIPWHWRRLQEPPEGEGREGQERKGSGGEERSAR